MKMTGLNQYQAEVLRTAPRDPRAYPACLRGLIALAEVGAAFSSDPEFESLRDDTLKIWDQLIWGLGLAGEAGEVADLLKKKYGHGKDVPRENIAKELGDVGWYQNAIADSFGYTAEDIATTNSDKLRARHPQGFTVESAEAKADELQPVEPALDDALAQHVAKAVITVRYDGNGTPAAEDCLTCDGEWWVPVYGSVAEVTPCPTCNAIGGPPMDFSKRGAK